MRKYFLVVVLFIMIVSAVGISAQSEVAISPKENSCTGASAKIMILGTYHMNNPGLDTRNLDADDVLLPKRQREINELNEKLARFNPTKIAIEGAYSDKASWDGRYKKYIAGDLKLGRDERDQIAFQLAKRLKLETIYPIDYPMLMSGLRYDEIESPKPKPSPAANADEAKGNAPVAALSEEDQLLRKSTVTEFLLYLNNEKKILKDHENYLRMLLPEDNSAIYQKSDLVTNWYKRNLRMFSNLNRITSFPSDRILLIVGSGHLKILKEFALDSPQFCLVEPDFYLKP